MIDPQRHRQLFLDDGAVESMSGLRRVLHQPINSTPVIIPDRSRGERAVQSASVPQWNPEIDRGSGGTRASPPTRMST